MASTCVSHAGPQTDGHNTVMNNMEHRDLSPFLTENEKEGIEKVDIL